MTAGIDARIILRVVLGHALVAGFSRSDSISIGLADELLDIA